MKYISCAYPILLQLLRNLEGVLTIFVPERHWIQPSYLPHRCQLECPWRYMCLDSQGYLIVSVPCCLELRTIPLHPLLINPWDNQSPNLTQSEYRRCFIQYYSCQPFEVSMTEIFSMREISCDDLFHSKINTTKCQIIY